MSKGISFQALQYTLILRDATGAKITGTGSIYDLEKTRTFATSIFQVNRRAAFIDIHPYIQDSSYYADTALETVHRSGVTVAAIPPIPAKEEPEPSEDQVEATAEVSVEKTPVELSPAPRRRDRRGKAKQEES